MIEPPGHYKRLTCDAEIGGDLLPHHVGVPPVVYQSATNTARPWLIVCPACNARVIGSHFDLAVESWNDKILGDVRSNG